MHYCIIQVTKIEPDYRAQSDGKQNAVRKTVSWLNVCAITEMTRRDGHTGIIFTNSPGEETRVVETPEEIMGKAEAATYGD